MATIIPVSPLSTIIQYFKGQQQLIDPVQFGDQISVTHKYGNGWDANKKGLTLKEEPSPAEIYLTRYKQRIEARVWANNFTECEAGYRMVVSFLNVNRVRVGNALMYSLIQLTSPFMGTDPVTSKSYWMFFLEAQVSTIPIEE